MAEWLNICKSWKPSCQCTKSTASHQVSTVLSSCSEEGGSEDDPRFGSQGLSIDLESAVISCFSGIRSDVEGKQLLVWMQKFYCSSCTVFLLYRIIW